MNRVVTFLFLVLPLMSLSQKDKSPKNGKAVFYYPSESKQKIIKSIGKNVDGLREGEWKFYHSNGKLDYTQVYSKGTPNGFRKTYLNDVLIYEENLVDSALVGQQNYYDDQGSKLASFFISNGSLDSIYQFYPENQKTSIVKIFKGTTLVKRIEFFSSGELKSIENFNLKNQLNGVQEKYVIDGKSGKYYLYYRKEYLNGELNGNYYEGGPNGPYLKCTYRNNEYDGFYTSFYYDGLQKHYEVKYENGIKSGLGTLFNDDGSVYMHEYWSGLNDKWDSPVFDSILTYFPTGSISSKNYGVLLPNGQKKVHYKKYFLNGKMELSYAEIDGNIEGLLERFYPNGQMERKVLYEKDKIQGSYLMWYEDGKKKLELFIENGKVTRQKGWLNNGKLLRVQDKMYIDLFDKADVGPISNPELDKYRDTESYSPFGNDMETAEPPHVSIDSSYGAKEKKNERVFNYSLKSEALFPGEKKSLDNFIKQNKRLIPTMFFKDNWTAVNVEMIIEADGSVSVISGEHLGMNQDFFPIYMVEAKRIISLMPLWIPAVSTKGENVASKRYVKFYF